MDTERRTDNFLSENIKLPVGSDIFLMISGILLMGAVLGAESGNVLATSVGAASGIIAATIGIIKRNR
jgi:uncharacterized membrane protein